MHASAVLVGARAVLIRGPSGAGKSRLALDLLAAPPPPGGVSPGWSATTVSIWKAPRGGSWCARQRRSPACSNCAAPGIMRLDYEPCAVVGLVVDLDAKDAERLPEHRSTSVEGINLPRYAVADGASALPGVVALLTSGGTGLDAAFSFEIC